jgi:hypothetical protein
MAPVQLQFDLTWRLFELKKRKMIVKLIMNFILKEAITRASIGRNTKPVWLLKRFASRELT